MDDWRHLPSYQLERRADIFFAVYLQRVLAAHLGQDVHERIIPEFPVRIGTIFPDIPIDKSYKIDYVTLTADGRTPLLVELKKDNSSRRTSQDKYLLASQRAGMQALLQGVIDIFAATKYKRKYFALLEQLAAMGLLELPQTLIQRMGRKSLQGVTAMIDDIRITSNCEEAEIIYIQPNGDETNVINFDAFADIIQDEADAVSVRFAESLREWASITPGSTAEPQR